MGLDPAARKAVWEHLEQLRARYGTTIFLSAHFMEEADAECSRVTIMHMGKIAASGTPAALKASLGQPGSTLDDVFVHYAGSTLELEGAYRETLRTRRTARRLG